MAKSLSEYEEIKVSFCPKCRSYNVRYVFGVGNIFGMIPRMQCMDCNTSAPSFPILTTTREALKKLKNSKKSEPLIKNVSKEKRTPKSLENIQTSEKHMRKKATAKKVSKINQRKTRRKNG